MTRHSTRHNPDLGAQILTAIVVAGLWAIFLSPYYVPIP